MAREEDRCWRCSTQWASEYVRPATPPATVDALPVMSLRRAA
jgi:hypothetical protein